MFEASAHQAQIPARNPIHSAWDWLSLPVITTCNEGMPVTTPDFDAELHVETTTIMFADVVESVRLIEQDELGNVTRIRALLKRLSEEVVPKHSGIALERRGDGLLIKFPDARCAAECAIDLHVNAAIASANLLATDVIALRIGMHWGDMLADESALYGRGMNTAARVAGLALPGETVVTANVRDQLTAGLDGEFEDMGDCHLKHNSVPVRSYRLRPIAERSKRRPQAPVHDAMPKPNDLRATMAVLPFEPYEGALAMRVFGVGDVLTDQVTTLLSRSASINMISRLSTNAFRGRRISNEVVWDRLQADYVVTGRYFQTVDEIRLWVELSQSTTGTVVWSDMVIGSPHDALAVDSQLVRQVVDGIAQAVLSSELAQARAMPLPNLSAHTLYLAAVSLMHRFSVADFDRSHAMLEALRERAPRHPGPLAWLARWHVFRVVQGWSASPDDDRKLGLSYSNRALDLDPESTLALTVAGSVRVNLGKQLDEAITFYDRALEINPNEGLAWLLKGTAQAFQMKSKEAITSCDKATNLSPLDPVRFLYDSLGATARLLDSDYSGAIDFAKRSLRANARHASSCRALAIAHALRGELTEARAAVAQLQVVEPTFTVSRFISRAPVSDSEVIDRYAEALRKAGLPA